MDKKYCDKCSKEIKGTYYVLSAWKYSTEEEIEKDDPEKEIEVCSECFEDVKF